ncbi:hypothetical protein TNCV_4285821 [Trichonephila clavipes]|nr:hypothetical protein TNCV_4285821 [Trichonephila clavipes]
MKLDAIDPTLDYEQYCAYIRSQEKEIAYHEMGLSYLNNVLNIEKKDSRDTCTPAVQKLEAEKLDIMEKLKKSQGELTLLIPCHVPDCTHNQKIKNLSQRIAETYNQPPKFTLPPEELPPAPTKNPNLASNNPSTRANRNIF